jgi:hypothetical protein
VAAAPRPVPEGPPRPAEPTPPAVADTPTTAVPARVGTDGARRGHRARLHDHRAHLHHQQRARRQDRGDPRRARDGSDGFTLPAGTKAVLELASVARDSGGNATGIDFRLRNLDDGATAYRVAAEVTTADTLLRRRSNSSPVADRRKVIGGAVAGAVLGQVLGKDTKGTVIGAAAGGAIGVAGAARGSRYEGCLPEGAKVRVRLTDGLVL